MSRIKKRLLYSRLSSSTAIGRADSTRLYTCRQNRCLNGLISRQKAVFFRLFIILRRIAIVDFLSRRPVAFFEFYQTKNQFNDSHPTVPISVKNRRSGTTRMTSATTAVSRKFLSFLASNIETTTAKAIPVNRFRYRRHRFARMLIPAETSAQSRMMFACRLIPSVP